MRFPLKERAPIKEGWATVHPLTNKTVCVVSEHYAKYLQSHIDLAGCVFDALGVPTFDDTSDAHEEFRLRLEWVQDNLKQIQQQPA